VRRSIGVVFQAPSLDRKLTVAENLYHQGRLYGLTGPRLRSRCNALLDRLGLSDRAGSLVETLSGGLRRRAELAKGMLHHPRLVLLDEPSTGLDPAVRNSLWEYFETIRRDEGVTIVMTTHLLEEADRADRIAMLHRGKLVALDAPEALRGTVGGDSITITCDDPPSLAADIREAFDAAANVVDGAVRLEQSDGHRWIARLVEAFPGRIQTVTLGKPTLEDVFIDRCGERLAAGRRSGVSS
jgi:ABC-2 type transport system ATP-binding protein